MDVVVGPWSLIDVAVIAAVAVVLPVCLGSPRCWWLAAIAVAASCVVAQGSVPAIVLAAIWPLIGAVVTVRVVAHAGPLVVWTRSDVVRLVACAYGLVAAGWFLVSRAGGTPLGTYEPIVELTAVHFTYVGVAAIVLADTALTRARGDLVRRVGWAALILTTVAPPVVALGFVTGRAVPQIGGAVLMSLGVFATAALELHAATRAHNAATAVALTVSGLSIWAPMVLAVMWAAGLHYDVPALSTEDMVHTHGAANALGFVAFGLLARHLERRTPDANAPDEVVAWR